MGAPAYLQQQVEVSLCLFQRDHEDLLFLQRVDPKYPPADEIGKLKKLQDEGKIKYIGISQAP